VSKILGINLGFESIPRVEIDGSGRFQILESKLDSTVSLVDIKFINFNFVVFYN